MGFAQPELTSGILVPLHTAAIIALNLCWHTHDADTGSGRLFAVTRGYDVGRALLLNTISMARYARGAGSE